MAVSRRSFLKGSAATAAMAMAAGSITTVMGKEQSGMQPGPGNKWPGKVVVNFNKDAVATGKVDTATVAKMIDASILALTGEATVGAAWKAIFPASKPITATSTIAIKVPLGCASQTMAPHWSSVKAIIDGLTKMDFGGTSFKPANITVYEMQCSDNFSNYGYTSANLPGVKILRDTRVSGSTDGASTSDGKTKYDYAKTLQNDYLINVFRLGGHGGDYSGFTLGFKNHFGTYNPNQSQTGHSGSGPAQAFLRDINCTGVVFNKNVLTVCVGLFGAKEASGQPSSSNIDYATYVKDIESSAPGVEPRTILMTTDPVSAEMQAIKIMRKNNGKSFALADLPPYLKASGGVAASLSDKVYHIGVIDESKMDIIKIINGEKVTTDVKVSGNNTGTGTAGLSVKSLRHSRSTFIEFSVPHAHSGTEAHLEIFDLAGKSVYSAALRMNGVVNHVSWNELTASGQRVSNGTYLVKLVAGQIACSQRFTLFR